MLTSQPTLTWLVTLSLFATMLVPAYATHTVASSPARPTVANFPSTMNEVATPGTIPLYFIENQGQMETPASYYVQGSDVSTFFSSGHITFTLFGPPQKEEQATPLDQHLQHLPGLRFGPDGKLLRLTASRPSHDLTLDFIGSNPHVEPVGIEATPTVCNYYKGAPDQWKEGVKTYSKIIYQDLWPGIDLVYSGAVNQLKYSFVVKPGADPQQIRLACNGATAVRTIGDGRLQISTPVGDVHDEKPYVYQEINGKRIEVASQYNVASPQISTSNPRFEVGFHLSTYDRSETLVVDPAMIVYAGYIGSAEPDQGGLGIAVDGSGNAYATGSITEGGEIFVAKVSADGSSLSYLTMIGGDGYDGGFDIAVDNSGNAYVVGLTGSDEVSFPVKGGPDLTFNGAFSDAFIAKLDTRGRLSYCGYIGGNQLDFAEGVAVDRGGNAYVTGVTQSRETSFPAVVGPDITYNGVYDTFVAKVKAQPTSRDVESNFTYCGYIGGKGIDVGVFTAPDRSSFVTAGHIALDTAGNAYISGITNSDETSFPDGDGFGNLPGADKTFNGGTYDAYIAKVRANGTGLLYASYVGGAGEDAGFGMAVDSDGNAYFGGNTDSDETTFPDGNGFGTLPGPDRIYNGNIDGMIVKMNPQGTALVFAGYIGGSGIDQVLGVQVDTLNNIYVTGHVESSEATFPVVGGPDLTFNGPDTDGDGYVAKLKPMPIDSVVKNNYEYCGYIGGSGSDVGFWLAVDRSGGDRAVSVYIAGTTGSDGTTFPTGNGIAAFPGPDKTFKGGDDAFVVKVSS